MPRPFRLAVRRIAAVLLSTTSCEQKLTVAAEVVRGIAYAHFKRERDLPKRIGVTGVARNSFGHEYADNRGSIMRKDTVMIAIVFFTVTMP